MKAGTTLSPDLRAKFSIAVPISVTRKISQPLNGPKLSSLIGTGISTVLLSELTMYRMYCWFKLESVYLWKACQGHTAGYPSADTRASQISTSDRQHPLLQPKKGCSFNGVCAQGKSHRRSPTLRRRCQWQCRAVFRIRIEIFGLIRIQLNAGTDSKHCCRVKNVL